MGRSIGLGTVVKAVGVLSIAFVTDQLLSAFRHNEVRNIERETAAVLKDLNHVSDSLRELKKEYWQLHLSAQEMDGQMEGLLLQLNQSSQQNVKMTALPTANVNEHESHHFYKNSIVTSGACRASTPNSKANLPTFIFVAGIEGSGHHALKSVWWSLEQAGVKLHLVVYDQLFHGLGIENHASYHYSSISKETYLERMGPVFKKAQQEGRIVIDAQNSYPMGKGAGSLAHPDLLMLSELDGVLFDLRVIVIYRDPVDAVLSAVRRFQNTEEYLYKNVEFQARMVSESLANIHNSLPFLPCGKYMVIDYEKLTQTPKAFVGELETLVGVRHDVLHGAFEQLTPRERKPDTPEKAAQRKLLLSFFRVQDKLWPWLATSS